MRRILFTFVAAVSFVLAIGLAYLWWRSHRTSDVWQHTTGLGRTRMLVSYAGGVHVAQVERGLSPALPFLLPTESGWSRHPLTGAEKWGDRYASLSQQINWSAGGFAVVSGHSNSPSPAILLTGNTGILNLSRVTTQLPAAPSSNLQMGGGVTVIDSNGASTISANTITFGANASTNVTLTTPANGRTNGTGAGAGSVVINGGTLNFATWNAPVTENHLAVVIPYWFPTSVCALIPLLWLAKSRRHWRDRRRARHGLCQNCGYDLRASTDRCPECGRAIESIGADAV